MSYTPKVGKRSFAMIRSEGRYIIIPGTVIAEDRGRYTLMENLRRRHKLIHRDIPQNCFYPTARAAQAALWQRIMLEEGYR